MPDEKIDQKRPVDADNEPKPIQQRHVDDTVDDSFPASDPPAWTTSASKSVAAECEPEALNEVPAPPGQGLEGQTGNSSVQSAVDQASGLAHDLYRRGQTYMEQGRRYLPEAEHYYQRGTEAMSRPVQEHPLMTMLAVGALGCAIGWLLGRRTANSGMGPQWHSGSSQRPRGTEIWRPAPRAVREARHFSGRDGVEAARHANNSF